MDWQAIFDNVVNVASTLITNYGFKLIASILILLIGFRVVRIVCKRLRKSKGFQKMDHSVASFLLNILGFVLRLLIILTVCAILEIPMSNFSVMLASAGLAVGLALQGSLSNLAGGVIILIFRPFSVDDFIAVNGISGTVIDISILYTTLRTPDGLRIVVPNGDLSNAMVTNYSIEEKRRVDVRIGVSYDSDLEKVEKVLLGLTEGNELIDTENPPVVVPGGYEDSSIIMILRVWCGTKDYWTVYNGFLKALKPAFDANGINIPFPQMDVHVKND
ncbi:MAG: mechanosensitive ion channel [Clostridia bacterium]|nr:mechanosensitive ion channel [Clostridia bacterium]